MHFDETTTATKRDTKCQNILIWAKPHPLQRQTMENNANNNFTCCTYNNHSGINNHFAPIARWLCHFPEKSEPSALLYPPPPNLCDSKHPYLMDARLSSWAGERWAPSDEAVASAGPGPMSAAPRTSSVRPHRPGCCNTEKHILVKTG